MTIIYNFRKLIIGLCFAIPFGIVAAVSVQAQSLAESPTSDDCQGCHEIIETHWQNSAHGLSISNRPFNEAWRANGSPDACLGCHTTNFDPATGTYLADNISCTVCHNPTPNNHPEDIMPTDISSRMCGGCHLDTYSEWEGSTHGQENLACVRCHSPHTTELRADGVQALCQSCHNNEAHYYSYTGHAEEGLLCADCHLRVSETQIGEGHGQRIHTFKVDMSTCSVCHADAMHYPTIAAASVTGSEEQPSAFANAPMEMPALQTAPDPVSPYGFAIIAALIGMGFGIILAPWLENWFRRINK